MIPVSAVRLGEEEERRVLDVLRSGHLAQGPVVVELEELFASLAGTRHAVAVSSGTTALVAALEVCDLEPGDEVITSPFTFAATLNAILEAGAIARFADISLDDYCLDAKSAAEVLTDRTRVIMPVHLYGLPADMTAIVGLADDIGATLVEDAAQAHGAEVDGRRTGSFGLGCFSLYATKNVTTGEGGVITTSDDSTAERLRILRNQGMRARYEYVIAGHNYRMTDLQAAVGVPQIGRLGEMTSARRRNADRLTSGLSDVAGLVLPSEPVGRRHVWHQYTVRVTPDGPLGRDEFVARLAEAGVGAGIYYPGVVFDHECYLTHPQVVVADVPRARAAAAQVVSLPVHPHLSDEDLDTVIRAVRRIMGS